MSQSNCKLCNNSLGDTDAAVTVLISGEPAQVHSFCGRKYVEFLNVDKGDKYRKTIGSTGGTATVDVYDVLKAFEVTCPAMQHALKKMLCAGLRGHKDFNKDVDEAIVSLQRAKELAGA